MWSERIGVEKGLSMLSLLLMAALAQGGGEEPQKGEPRPDPPAVEASWKKLGEGIWFDPKEKRVILEARVVLREGPLEHLLCSTGTKEHESILATSAPPRLIHAGLLLTGAEPGKPAEFDPEFKPPTGPPIRIEAIWTGEGGKRRTEDVRTWIQDEKTKGAMTADWVFAGSALYKDPDSGVMRYAADSGDLITVANFASSILDVGASSTSSDAMLLYAANPARVPAEETKVLLVLRPVKNEGSTAELMP